MRSWTIVAATFVTLVLAYGLWYAYAVFLVALLKEFHWSRSLVSGAFSVFMLVHGLLGPVVGWLARRYGTRRLFRAGGGVLLAGVLLASATTEWWHLYLAYGVLIAVGMSLSGWVPCVILIRGWFPLRFGTAMGLASAGIGVGILSLSPLAQLLVDALGWRWAYRIFGLAILAWLLPATAWLIRDAPDADAGDPGGPAQGKHAEHWVLAAAVRDLRFWLLAATYFTGTLVAQVILVHQVAYLVDHAVPPMLAASLAGLVGLSSIAGKVGWGALSDRIGREATYTLAYGCMTLALALLMLVGRHPHPALLYGYAVAAGLGYGVLSPVQPAAASDLFGGPGFSTIYGALYVPVSLGGAFGAWLAGAIYDWQGGYGLALWVGMLTAIVSPALLWLAAPRRPHPPQPRVSVLVQRHEP
jgi:MFS family permease